MLLTILLSAASTVATPPTLTPPRCEKPRSTLAGGADRPLIKPLGEAPPAQHILAVLHTDFDGCVKPVAARSNARKR